MRKLTLLLLAVALVGGCTLQDENPNWNPKADLPAWAYDAPFYYRPTEDLKPLEVVGRPGIPIYYTNTEYFFVLHPGGYQPTGEPRVAVWCSTDEESWERSGYFGVEQTHFLMKAEQDGQYWMRFVGPGQDITEVPPGQPHRIYVVDRQPPKIVMMLEPPPYRKDEQGKYVPYIYKVGENVLLHWEITDENLKDESVNLAIGFAKFPQNLVWDTHPRPLEPCGSVTIVVTPEMARDGGVRFRMEAADKAGNVGMAVTDILNVEGQSMPAAAGVRPVKPSDPVLETAGTPDKKRPGWPSNGAFLRGGVTRELKWLPETKYKVVEEGKEVEKDRYVDLELQFSSNDGRSWTTLASNLPADSKKITWTVPEVTSRSCRLRILGTDEQQNKRVALVLSGRFTVDTIVPGMMEKPTSLPAE